MRKSEQLIGLYQTRLRTTIIPLRATEIPYVLYEAIISGEHACVKTACMSWNAKAFSAVLVRIAERPDVTERLVAAFGADEQVRAAVDALDAGAGCPMEDRCASYNQGRHQKGTKRQ